MSNELKPGETDKLWTISNIITLVRICLVPVFVVALITPWPTWFSITGVSSTTKSLIAALIFILISCTDWLDGYLARSRGEVTNFGKFMDPLADKILVCAALLALVELRVLPSWPVLIILAREFIVSGIRMVAADKGVVIAASWYGKAKTVTQIIAIVLFIVKDSILPVTSPNPFDNPLYVLSWLVMVVALALTIISMMDYFAKARHLLGFTTSKERALQQEENAKSESNEEIARRIIESASEKGATIGCAESLTGGLIAGALTAIPGSSQVVHGADCKLCERHQASRARRQRGGSQNRRGRLRSGRPANGRGCTQEPRCRHSRRCDGNRRSRWRRAGQAGRHRMGRSFHAKLLRNDVLPF